MNALSGVSHGPCETFRALGEASHGPCESSWSFTRAVCNTRERVQGFTRPVGHDGAEPAPFAARGTEQRLVEPKSRKDTKHYLAQSSPSLSSRISSSRGHFGAVFFPRHTTAYHRQNRTIFFSGLVQPFLPRLRLRLRGSTVTTTWIRRLHRDCG